MVKRYSSPEGTAEMYDPQLYIYFNLKSIVPTGLEQLCAFHNPINELMGYFQKIPDGIK